MANSPEQGSGQKPASAEERGGAGGWRLRAMTGLLPGSTLVPWLPKKPVFLANTWVVPERRWTIQYLGRRKPGGGKVVVLRGLFLLGCDVDEESPGQLPASGISHQQLQGAKIPPFCKISHCWCLLEGGRVAEHPHTHTSVCSPLLFIAQKKGEINNNFFKRGRKLSALRFFGTGGNSLG